MSKLIILDAGHGGSDPGACANGLNEKDIVSSITKFCKEDLLAEGYEVLLTRKADEYIGINERAAFANKHKAALFVSIHTNAGSGDGVEVIYSVTGGTSLKMAQNMVDSINKVTGQNKRAREIYTKVNDQGHDYFGVIRQTKMPAVIVECAFIDSKDVEIIDTTAERKLMGEAIARGIISTLGVQEQEDVKGTPIIGEATATVEQCKEWAKSKQAKQTFIDNADIYFEICKQVGINPVVAYVQYGLESGFGHHRGVVPESYYNPCGLKVTKVGTNSDSNPKDHAVFKSWRDGISAHVDHIALYAGVLGYPKSNTLDTRHFSDLYGKYKTVEDIGKGWCPSNPKYGNTLIQFMKEVESIKLNVDEEYKRAVTKLSQELDISMAAWYPESNPKNLIAMVQKIGRKLYGITKYEFVITRLKQDGIISNELLWLEHEYSVGNIKSLIKKVAAFMR